MWKYHPHGDSSIYEAMVRMAQPRSLRYPLVDWQGNFWSIDWDSAAAMRYTEARLTEIAQEMLSDIEQDTIDRVDNFDWSLKEPRMLPTKFPNHLCNWTMGIAVGMATNMAPHNLNEILDACILLLNNEWKPNPDWSTNEISIDQIMEIIKWPDFPTWWIIYDSNNIKEVYKNWQWGIVVRWKTHIEESHWWDIIVIDEIPYLVNKSWLVSRIWELVVDKKIDWIVDIRDESNKNKIRIAIYLRKWVDADWILVQLYKSTDLQCNFNVNNVSLIESGIQPRLLNIKDLLMEYLVFRRQVVYRRSVFQLKKAQDRLHILEWLKKAIDIIDEVIDTIKKSQTKADAKKNLIDKFQFTEAQAEYILLMRLQSLVWLEIQKVTEEIEEKKKAIEYLQSIINDPIKLDGVVEEEFNYMKKKYWDPRKSELSQDLSVYNIAGSLKALQAAADRVKEDVIVWIWNDYSLRVLYQSRIQIIPDETLELIYTHNQDKFIVITDIWELVVQRLKDLWQFTMAKTSLNLNEYFGLKWKIIFAKTLHFDYENLVLFTNLNSIKKIKKELVLSFKKFPTKIMNLWDKEKILSVEATNPWDNLCILSQQWWMNIFPNDNIRPMWKTAGGVKAIELQEWDKVANMFLHKNEPFILIHSKKDGKLLNLEDLRIWKRARKWMIVMTWNSKLEWWISIIEWAIRIRYPDWEIKTLHSNDIRLDEPETPLHKMVDKEIDIIYRPREEKDENMKYKEDRKKAQKEEERLNNQQPLLKEDEDNNIDIQVEEENNL
jgi:DNA gyrase subunit A